MKGIAHHARKQGARRFIWRCGSFFGVFLMCPGSTACDSCTPCTACTLSGSARSAALRRAPCSSIIRGGYICASVMQFESAHTTPKTNKKGWHTASQDNKKGGHYRPPQIPQNKKQKALIITHAIIISRHFANTFNPSQPFSTD